MSSASPLVRYYGGKASIGERLCALFPAHRVYTEPFVGGGSVFFFKPKSEREVLNDANGEIENFYRWLQRDPQGLSQLAIESCHSRNTYNRARRIYRGKEAATDLERAWAFWYLVKTSFAGKPGAAFASGLHGHTISSSLIKSSELLSDATYWRRRMLDVTLESGDALNTITRYDYHDSLHYCDPPYVGSHQGHYRGYTESQYQALLDKLASIEGRFVLSSYPNPQLAQAVATHGWRTVELNTRMRATNIKRAQPLDRARVEMVAMNYPEHLSGGGMLFG